MYKEEDNYLSRRLAFWDNFQRDFECVIKSFEANSAGKFIDADDDAVVKTVSSLLRGAYYFCAKRYHEVFGEHLEAYTQETKA